MAKGVDIGANSQTFRANLSGKHQASLTIKGDDQVSIGLKNQMGTPFVTIGSIATVVQETNSEIKYKPSTIAIFNKKAEVAWQKP